MTPLPVSQIPAGIPLPAGAPVSSTSSPFTCSTGAASKPGDIAKPSDPFDTTGWLEWLSQSPADEMAERVHAVQTEASVRMILFYAGFVYGPIARRERLEVESAARVKADDERRHASGRRFWE